MKHQGYIVAAALFGFLAVAAHAFAGHLLEAQDHERALRLVRTGANLQIWHALAIIACAALGLNNALPLLLFSAGIVLFSGSLYLLASGAPSVLGIITPIGGTLLLLGWLSLAWLALRHKHEADAT